MITSWSFEAGANPPTLLRFKAFRHAPGPFEFLVVGRSDAEVPAANETSTFDTRIPVQAGDLIGFYAEGASLPCMRNQSGFTLEFQSGDKLAGVTTNYVPGDNPLQLDIAAQLEPDADNDGFGDETQDQCPSDSGIQTVACRDTTLPDTTPPDTTAPETTIIEKPKKKSTKRKATFTFSSEAGATFKCSLDGEPFNACTSPLSFTAKPGRHSFVVFAKDAAGNVDDTPATASWMVKKKKK